MSENPFETLQKLLVSLTAMSRERETVKLGRKAVAIGAKLFRRAGRNKEATAEQIAKFVRTAEIHEDETSNWVAPMEIAEGRGGPFDAADLRHWLLLAEMAGIKAVPAKEILHLDEEEINLLSGAVPIPDGIAARAMRQGAKEFLTAQGIDPDYLDQQKDKEIDTDELEERLFAAMDAVPEGWMVRSARCGSSQLKALAGAGAAGPEVPEVRFGPGLEIGPGWIRKGNRRRIDVADERTVMLAAQGPPTGTSFLARPWVSAARWFVGEDPHRHGTPFAGKGIWPAEWRAFVEHNKVVGVSTYYGWCGEASPENARIAMEVRDKAQAITNNAVGMGAWPRNMEVEFIRASKHAQDPKFARMLETFGRETVSCTLDFIETEHGIMLLEGGPACTPFGGGHPCAFAGCGGQPRPGNPIDINGVAFRLMPHVSMADPNTWTEGDRTGCILTWEEVVELASSPANALKQEEASPEP